MSRTTKYITFLILLIAAGITARVLPHAANFVPVTALALLAAAYLPRRLAIVVPVAIMIASDLIIGMHPLFLYTWGSFALIGYVGSLVYGRTGNRWHLAAMGPIGSIIFFTVTNFAVWLQGNMYEHSLAGLVRCFTMALPFFRGTLLSDIAYTPLLFMISFFALKAVRAASTLKVSSSAA